MSIAPTKQVDLNPTKPVTPKGKYSGASIESSIIARCPGSVGLIFHLLYNKVATVNTKLLEDQR